MSAVGIDMERNGFAQAATTAAEDVTLKVKPNASRVAGTYPVSAAILSGENTAKARVALEITGSSNLSPSQHQKVRA